MHQQNIAIWVMYIFTATFLVGCGQDNLEIPKVNRVILITIDALRADHLGCYGYRRNTSPEIDRFANKSTLFLNAYTAWPKTSPSFAALFTGLWGKTTGVTRQCFLSLPEENRTLAEILSEAGFRCIAIVNNANLAKEFNLCQGFEVIEELWKPKPSTPEKQTERAIQWMDKLGEREKIFIFIHYLGPHAPYNMFSDSYKDSFIGDKFYKEGHKITFNSEAFDGIGGCPPHARLEGSADLAHYTALYDASIRYFDDCTGRILNWLKERGLLDDSLIIISADHGESLGEHNYYFEHGQFAYNSCLRVPLIIHFPRSKQDGQIIEIPVSLLDIMPTVLELTSVRYRGLLQGESLVPIAYQNKERKNPEIYTEAGYANDYQRAIISEKWKLIYFPDPHERNLAKNTLFELYDLEDDPGETKNVADAHPEVTKRLKKKLLEWLSKDAKTVAPGTEKVPPIVIDEATKDNLRALGYIE